MTTAASLGAEAPIGVFDSGVGGISVLKELTALLPPEDFIYYGDSAYAPYGGKTREEVVKRARAIAEHLTDKGVKAIVIACNTATAAAAETLRALYPEIPVVGMEPAIKPAALSSAHPRVLIMATEMTLHLEKFRTLMKSLENEAEFDLLPCPGLVRLTERGLPPDETDAYLRDVLAPYLDPSKAPDCIVLGCTHFPFARDRIDALFGHRVRFYDGAGGTANRLKCLLAERGLLSKKSRGSVVFESSANSPEILFKMKELYGGE